MAEMSPGDADLFEEVGMSGRAAHSSRLWIDNNGQRLPIRYTYSESDFYSVRRWNEVVTFWTENTCLTFKKEDISWCSTKQSAPALLLRSDVVTENFGIDKGKSCTKFGSNTLQKHVMNALGMLPYMYRNDSAEHISRNIEHMESWVVQESVTYMKTLLSPYHRCHGKTALLPTPFDYMSIQSPESGLPDSPNPERLPVYVTRDPKRQYLLDYHDYADSGPTFYDVLVINTLYKCPAEWAADCSGTVPTCRNHGYLLRTCECRCPPGFSGDTCQTKTGPLFPLQPASYEVNVTADQTYDFSSLNVQTIDTADKYAVIRDVIIIIVHIAPKKANYLPSISLFLPFDAVQKKLGPLQETLIEDLLLDDCSNGQRLLWGSGRRLACECVSSLVNNEPASEVRVFRGRKPGMGMTLINKFNSAFYKQEGITELTSQYLLTAEFRPPPEFSMAEKKGELPTPVVTGGGNITGGGGDNITGVGGDNITGVGGDNVTGSGGDNITGAVIDSSSTGAMKSTLDSAVSMSLVVGPPLLLLLLCCLLLYCCRRRGANKKQVAEPRGEEHDSSGSESEGSEDSED